VLAVHVTVGNGDNLGILALAIDVGALLGEVDNAGDGRAVAQRNLVMLLVLMKKVFVRGAAKKTGV
jgi:hypothetical protein